MKKKLFLFLTFCFYGAKIFGQHEMTLFHMNNVFQGTYVNPTLIPENKVSIGLPGISSLYGGVYFSPFVANDLKQKNGDVVSLSLDKAISKMSRYNNYFYTSTAVDLFSLRVKARNLYFSVNVSNITSVRLNLPRDLFSLAWYGNAQYVGSSVNLKNMGIDAMQYNEYAVGVARSKDGGKFRYGARVKLLQGLNNFYTQKSNGEISIDDKFYQHTLTANIMTRSASVIPYDSNNIDYMKAATNFQNLGWGLDLGVTYMPSKKWEITGAVNNIGAITWKTNAKSYSIDGSYKFSGISLDSLTANGEVGGTAYIDSLKSVFNLKEQKSAKYRTPLTPSLYFSVAYKLGRNTKLAVTAYSEVYKGIRPAGSLALIQRAGRVLNVVVSYNVRKNSYNNMGLGLMIKPGPFQIYVVGDNMLILNPFNSNNFYLRTGMNLVFGKTRRPEMQSHNED